MKDEEFIIELHWIDFTSCFLLFAILSLQACKRVEVIFITQAATAAPSLPSPTAPYFLSGGFIDDDELYHHFLDGHWREKERWEVEGENVPVARERKQMLDKMVDLKSLCRLHETLRVFKIYFSDTVYDILQSQVLKLLCKKWHSSAVFILS